MSVAGGGGLNSRTVIQITKNVQHLRYSVCIYTHTHTHVALVRSYCLIGKPYSLGGPSRVRGGHLAPYDHICDFF